MSESFEILALTCHNTDCPTLLHDPATGRIGVQGYASSRDGEELEHIAWMDPAAWSTLRNTPPPDTAPCAG